MPLIPDYTWVHNLKIYIIYRLLWGNYRVFPQYAWNHDDDDDTDENHKDASDALLWQISYPR